MEPPGALKQHVFPQQNYKEELAFKVRAVCAAVCASDWNAILEVIIWLRGAADLLISLTHQRLLPVAIEMIISRNWHITPSPHIWFNNRGLYKAVRHLLV